MRPRSFSSVSARAGFVFVRVDWSAEALGSRLQEGMVGLEREQVVATLSLDRRGGRRGCGQVHPASLPNPSTQAFLDAFALAFSASALYFARRFR